MSDTEILAPPEIKPTHQSAGKFEREMAAFRRLLPGLLEHYRNQYVAIHGEEVIGSGDDILKVAHAAYEKFGYQPIYVDLVTDEPQPLVRIASPRVLSNG